MKTLIELFDERPIENVLSTEMFHPETTVFLCPGETAENKELKSALKNYFKRRGCGNTRLVYLPVSTLSAESVEKSLRHCVETYEDCAVDISGGTDAALFAAGRFSTGKQIPVFTYSRKRNTFFEISNAPFARALPCSIRLSVKDCFLMAGGAVREGRAEEGSLRRHLRLIEPLFKLFDRYRRIWQRQTVWFQHASQKEEGLEARAPETVHAQNHTVGVSAALLKDLSDAGLIEQLSMGKEITFRFASEMVRFWLRDAGSALECWIYKNCLDSGLFEDVRLSVVVNWSGEGAGESVTNEIDVVCVRGTVPFLISCKACDVKTEALNELKILKDRFGGYGSQAAVITSSAPGRNGSAMRRRASELGIEVIEHRDLDRERLQGRIRALTAPR